MSTPDAPLLALLAALEARAYQFVTPHNGTSRLQRARRADREARSLRDVLGWSLPFRPGQLDPEIERLLSAGDLLVATSKGLRATVRVSTVQSRLFLHSAWPPTAEQAVFLGPDTYRFAEFLRVELSGGARAARVLDIGAGAGVGGVVAGRLAGVAEVVLTDVNPEALRLAAVNAAHARVPVRTVLGEGLEAADGRFDLIVANPPFIAGAGRTYSDGGGMHGSELSLAWARDAMGRLNPGGRLLMYTGAAIVDGQDALRTALEAAAEACGCAFGYRELDPDIFSGELGRPAYADVERIAAVGAVARRA